jgi:DNA-binding MarR family transcriptional regulator
VAESHSAALQPPGSDLAARLELTFRLLGRRVYRTSPGQLRAVCPGLDKASLPLLAALEDHDEVRPSDVAAAVELDLSTVSRHLRQMEQFGLVERRPDGADGRACRIRLTARGRQSLSAVRASRAATLDDVFRGWPDVDRRRMQRLLDRLLADLAALPATTLPEPSLRAIG